MQKAASLLKNAHGLTGWSFVQYHMDRQLESGRTTANDWAEELSGQPHQAWVLADPADPTSKLVPVCVVNPSREKDPTQTSPGRTKIPVLYERPRRMQSWNLFLAFQSEGSSPPAWAMTIRSDDELAEFAGYCYGAMRVTARLGVRIRLPPDPAEV